ncbi:MAG: methionine--tRNA ligase [Gemmatimonadales bacterium]
MSKPFYVTTAIDYSNGDPHLGHALEKVGADVIARWHRLQAQPVHFVMGMDEHAQKVLQAAEAANTTPQQWVDRMSARFEQAWAALGCSHDDWMRTTQTRHAEGVTALIDRIQERHPDAFYEGEYEGLYCVGCEEFKSESQVEDGRCVEHPSRELVPTRERNTFFRLSAWRDEVLDRITSGELVVAPDIRRNEILRILEGGLIDISVSRSRLPWGIPFPGTNDQTVYVWFEALMNYLSATGFPDGDWDALWPADVHVVGKGITRFHCCIWPAILLAAGLPLPRMVWAHGYVQWDGAKVSKSEGTGVSLGEAIDRHGPDALRYFLLREIGFTADGDFSFDRFDAVYASELADGVGNLASRVLAMVVKYRDGLVPTGEPDPMLADATRAAAAHYRQAMDATEFKRALEELGALVRTANSFITTAAPWTLAKAGEDAALDRALRALSESVLVIGVMMAPFMPGKSAALLAALGRDGTPTWCDADAPDLGGARVAKPDNLFPKTPQSTS